MLRILLVQNPSAPEVMERERQNYQVALGADVFITYLSSLDESLSWKEPKEVLESYDALILGGSRDYDFDGGRKVDDPFRILAMLILSRTRNLIRYALAHNIPTLGICFGHQVAANMFGGEVANDKAQAKRGTFNVILTEEGKRDAVFRHLPESFDVQYGHKDSVTKLPEGAVMLACSPDCKFSALRYGAHMYTVQFHPEITAERMILSINSHADSLPVGISRAEDIVRPSHDASRIIPIWIAHVVRKTNHDEQEKL